RARACAFLCLEYRHIARSLLVHQIPRSSQSKPYAALTRSIGIAENRLCTALWVSRSSFSCPTMWNTGISFPPLALGQRDPEYRMNRNGALTPNARSSQPALVAR